MNCKNCGAPMVLETRGGYFHCEYCGSYYFPTPSSDGIRALGESEEDIICPVCGIPLEAAILDDRYAVNRCPKCRGLLLNRSVFRDALESRRAAATTPPARPRPLDRTELHREIDCPQCERTMTTLPYLGPGNIVIDTCAHCDLIWLDYGEFQEAENAPGRDRSVLVDDDQKRATVHGEDSPPNHSRSNRRHHAVDLINFVREQLLGEDAFG
ncbi:MAG: zf-TFIIB domain-containing protein [Anaerolineae bacterium]